MQEYMNPFNLAAETDNGFLQIGLSKKSLTCSNMLVQKKL